MQLVDLICQSSWIIRVKILSKLATHLFQYRNIGGQHRGTQPKRLSQWQAPTLQAAGNDESECVFVKLAQLSLIGI